MRAIPVRRAFARRFAFPFDAGRGRPVSKDESSMLVSSGDAPSTGLGTGAPSRRISQTACLIELTGKAVRRRASTFLLLAALALVPLVAYGQEGQDWQDLSPRERYDAMRNYKQHRQLPEERQRDVEERYERFRQLPQEEQARIRQNYDRFKQLRPQERERFEKRYERWKRRRAPKE